MSARERKSTGKRYPLVGWYSTGPLLYTNFTLAEASHANAMEIKAGGEPFWRCIFSFAISTTTTSASFSSSSCLPSFLVLSISSAFFFSASASWEMRESFLLASDNKAPSAAAEFSVPSRQQRNEFKNSFRFVTLVRLLVRLRGASLAARVVRHSASYYEQQQKQQTEPPPIYL